MNKNRVINNKKFRDICNKIGLDWSNFEIYNDTIILPSSTNSIFNTYILFDSNYNIIGIHTITAYNYNLPKEKIIDIYKTPYEKLKLGSKNQNMSNPLKNYTIKQIVELSHKVTYRNIDEIFVHKKLVIDNYGEAPTNRTPYIQLLLYIKFLGEIIKEYYYNSYHAKKMGINYLNIYDYIFRIIYKIEECIDINIENNKNTLPEDIINNLGLKNIFSYKYRNELCCIINLLLNSKCYKHIEGPEHYREIEPITKSNIDIVSKADDLLSLLDVSDEEIKVRREEYTRTRDFKTINLGEYLSKKRGVSLLRKKNSQ